MNVLSIILIEHELVKTLDYLNFMNNFAKQFAKNFIDFYIPYLKFKILIMLKMQKKNGTKGQHFGWTLDANRLRTGTVFSWHKGLEFELEPMCCVFLLDFK